MKSVVFLYSGNPSPNKFEPLFDGTSSFELSLLWAINVKECDQIVVLGLDEFAEKINSEINRVKNKNSCQKQFLTVLKPCWTTSLLVQEMAVRTASCSAECAVYAWADCPLLDQELTYSVTLAHEAYLSEYTFADGYPYGFAPEVINAGTLNVLSSLAQGSQKSEGDKFVTENSVFALMKNDINSFEVETVISPVDYRLLRLYFTTKNKIELTATQNLYSLAKEKGIKFCANELSRLAAQSVQVQRTVPSFYNIQVTSKTNQKPLYYPFPEKFMMRNTCINTEITVEQMNSLAQQIVELSHDAVVSFSLWGEPLLHDNIAELVGAVLKYHSLSVLIETNGVALTEELAAKIKSEADKYGARTNDYPAVSFIVDLDAADSEKYMIMHGIETLQDASSQFDKAVNSVSILEKYFAGCVYPQFLRVNNNEDQLEKFYRSWSSRDSVTGGKVIIQKFSSFCGLYNDEKPADLSPVERNTCWHLKRDFCILSNGDVPVCRESLDREIIGNVFAHGLQNVWNRNQEMTQDHLDKNYCQMCRDCDEYYTFNF